MKARLRSWFARRLGVPEIPFALERLKSAGFAPNHVFDVGAYEGEFARTCIRVWPDCRITCFEVQPAPLARLRASLPRDEVQVFECLLGAKSDEHVTLHLAETASSVLVEKASPQQAQAHFPMRTIDEVIETELAGRSPDFLKLDVQGYELEVLTGAKEHLRDVQLVLAEVNLLDIHAEVPLLHELVAWFAARQWVAFDICGLTRRPLDKALWQADFLFVPEDSALRLDKRWKS